MKTLDEKKDEKFSAFSKIVKCIDSCVSVDQLNSCTNLIRNFSKKFEKDFKEMSYYEAHVLSEVIQKKIIELS